MYSIPSYYELGSCSNYSGNFLQDVVLSSTSTTTTTMGNSSSIAEKKAAEASKNHSEAERRRRKRINSHLATLRSLLPNTIKTDKASLLAEVVRRLRDLKQTTAGLAASGTDCEITQSNLFPTEADELSLCYSEADTAAIIKATLCCEDRPELISEIKTAVKAAEGKVVRAELATVGGRCKSILWVQLVSPGGGGGGGGEVGLVRLRRALKAVVDRAVALSNSGSGLQALPENKRARLSHY